MIRNVIFEVLNFRNKRDWKQFHTGENLAKSISIEAAELLEEFQWNPKERDLENLKQELADILIYCILLADAYNLDIEQVILEKLKENEIKYPVETSKGSSKKYNEK